MPAYTYWRMRVYNGGLGIVAVADWKFYAAGSVLIPTTGGTASASNAAFGAASNAFDGLFYTYWGCSADPTPAAPQWLQYQFASPIDPVTFTIQARDGGTYAQAPGSFALQGSNDGSTWVTIGNYSSTWSASGQINTYTVGAFGLGDFYRILIASNDGGGVHSVAEMKFYDAAAGVISLVNGAAMASGVYSGEDSGPARAFDANGATYWVSPNTSAGHWLGYRLAGSPVVGSFSITARTASFNQTPHTFTLQKSTDGGTVWSDVQAYTATVWTSGQTQTFTLPVPASIALAPTSGQQGAAVSLAVTGTATHFSAGVTTVAISGADVTLGTPSVTSATALTVSVTIAAGAAIGSRTITVTTGAEVVTAAFAVTAGAPVIALSPDSGAQASSPTVTITGTFTHFSAGVTTAAISGAGVTLGTPSVTSATALAVSATIAAGAALGVRTVTVTTGAEVATADFEITEILCIKRERGTISPEQIQAQFRQGNSPVVLMAAGEFIPGNVIVSDECGNAVDGGAAPGGGFFVNGVPV